MELELYEINVTLSKDQKQKIRNAFINHRDIRMRLSKDALRGSDTLLVPSQLFEGLDDAPNGIDASIDDQTFEEMKDEMREELKSLRDQNLSVMLKQIETDVGYESLLYKKFEKLKSLRDQNLSDEMLECEIYHEMWEYYGLCFLAAIDESMENKGIEFNLNYSLVNDLAKDFVKDNIKKLFQ